MLSMSLSTDCESDCSPPRIFMAGWMARKFRLQKTAANTAQRMDRVSRTRNGQELRTARRKFLMGVGFYPKCQIRARQMSRAGRVKPQGVREGEWVVSP